MKNVNVRNKIIDENFSRLKYLSIIFICYSVFVLIVDLAPITIWVDENLKTYTVLDISFSCMSVCSLIFFWFYKRENYFIKNFVTKFTFFFVLVWSAIITGIELSSLGFSTLILIILIGVFFIYNNLIISIIYFSGAFVTLAITIYFQNHLDKSLIPTIFIILPITIIASLISWKNYSAKVKELTNSSKLEDLNCELSAIKDNLEEEVERRTKELIAAKEKAEESDHLKSSFLANISHEIRTPMNGILGFAELLKEPNITGEEQLQYISIIEKGGIRMLNLINQLIDISKIESGLAEVTITETNINKLVEYIYTFFKPQTDKKGLEYFVKSSLEEGDAVIKTDKEKIYAILTNLVNNAIKYTEAGLVEIGCCIKTAIVSDDKHGVESVANHGVESKANHGVESKAKPRDKSSEMLFYVKDTGIGIAKERQSAIFERFIQADIEDKDAYQGAGLGLSISKAYVEMLGGKIWVESEQGKGSVFNFTIPFSNYAPAKKLADGKLNILIAEDDEASEMLLSIAVASFAKKVFKTKTGCGAVDICRENPDIDLVLMDIQMSKMNGYEATRQIRKFNTHVYIIAQTAFAMAGDREKALAAGCNDYIAKPLNRKMLKEMLFRG